jgi:hypothetical protein
MATKERTYSDAEVEERLKKELPHWHLEGGWIRRKFKTNSWKGTPAEFSIKSASDDVLATAVVKAVKQWRFLPAEINGKPVATKVALPVKIVDPVELGDRYAAFK